MVKFLVAALVAAAVSGCVTPPAPLPAQPPAAGTVAPGSAPDGAQARYRCDQNIVFTVKFTNDAAVVDAGARGSEVLLRDAGGVTPQQTVYSNPKLRAEFGLGASGREAILRYLAPALVANCRQD